MQQLEQEKHAILMETAMFIYYYCFFDYCYWQLVDSALPLLIYVVFVGNNWVK